jgi:uncharacterized protein (UPF0332 family)
MDAARRRLAAAEAAIIEDPSVALSAAYYGMLYAVRAALSERGVHARTHRGAWHEFRRLFVEPGTFPADVASAAHRTQSERELADYDAWLPSIEEARRAIAVAREFVAIVEELLV